MELIKAPGVGPARLGSGVNRTTHLVRKPRTDVPIVPAEAKTRNLTVRLTPLNRGVTLVSVLMQRPLR
jgi:hypothetical protein